MNAAQLAFSVHDRDLKQGSGSPCDDALYGRAVGWFDSLEDAAMFTPGDNDWTDCDRPANGGFSSRERLDRERQLFFLTPSRAGRTRCAKKCRRRPRASASRGRRRASRTAAG
jgi:hypothetical protein